MAQLKDTTIQGSARVTDTLYSNAVQAKIFNIPTASNGTTYGPGTDGQVLKSNGTSVYWASDSNSDVNVKQLAAITTAGAYPIILANSTATTEVTGTVNKSANLTYNPSTKALSTGGTINGLTFTAASTGFTIAGGTTSKTLTVSNTYTLGAACAKGVTDNSSNADVTSTDTNLITGRTLYYQLAKKGYTTNTGTVTSVTLTSGSGITVSDSGTAITGSGSRTISITGMNTSSGSTSKCLTEKGTWASFSNNSGTVTSVTLTSGAGITVSDSGTAITGSGSRTISITGVDTSSGSTTQCLTKKGTWASFTNNAGTVTSVQVQASGPLSSSTSTAQSSTLSTTISFSNQDPNKVLAGPSSGSSAAAPTFRALVAADIPNLSWNKITSDKPTTLSGYGITDAISSSALNDYVLKAGDTMTGNLIANNYCTKWGYEYLNSSGTNVGGFYIDMYNDNNQFYIDEYTAGGATSGVRECYLLPSPTASVATWYNILTDKNAVTIAQGGTGANNAADARTNLGLGSMATASTGDYVAKSGDTMTGALYVPSGSGVKSSDQNKTFNFFDASGNTKGLIRYSAATSQVDGFIQFEMRDASGNYTAMFNLPNIGTLTGDTIYDILTTKDGGYLPLSGSTMTGAITLANTDTPILSTGNDAGWFMNKYGSITHKRSNTNDYVGIIGYNVSGDIRFYYDSGNITTNGYVNASNGVYATNGTLVTRAAQPMLYYQNASAQGLGEIFVAQNHLYLRTRPSAGSSYYTDYILGAASGGSYSRYLYSTANFSLSGTTLTITPPGW